MPKKAATWDAFISYSHSVDGRLAPALQSGLQRFLRPWYRRTALRIFRDTTGLGADPSLWGSIQAALDSSRFFILLASPEAAGSPWVNRELEHWLSRYGTARLLLVVSQGPWMWDPVRGDFAWDRATAVPEALASVYRDEPKYLDLRWVRGEQDLDLRNPRFADAIADLAAPIYGKHKDDLIGEDVLLRRRATRLTGGAIGGLLILTLAALAAAYVAERRRVEAVAQRLSVQSAHSADRPVAAFYMAATAYRLLPSPDITAALYKSLHNVPELAFVSRRHRHPVWSVAIVADRDLLVSGDYDGHILATSSKSGDVVARFDEPARAAIAALFPDPEVDALTVSTPGGLFTLSLSGLSPVGAPMVSEATVLSSAYDRVEKRAAVGTMDGALILWDVHKRRAAGRWHIASEPIAAVAFSSDGDRLATGLESGTIQLWSLSQMQEPLWSRTQAHIHGAVTALAFSGDGRTLLSGGTDGWVRTWNVGDGSPGAGRRSHTGSVTGVGMTIQHPAGEWIASVGPDGSIQWLDAATSVAFPPTRLHQGRVNAIAFAGDGSYATAGNDGLVAYYQPNRPFIAGGDFVMLNQPPSTGALHAVTGRIAIARGPEGVVEVWDTTPLQPTGQAMRSGTSVTSVQWLPGGKGLALGLLDGGIILWEPATDAVHRVTGHNNQVLQLAVAADGKTLVSLAEKGDVLRWRVSAQGPDEPVTLSRRANRAMALSVDGKTLAYGTRDELGIEIVDLAAGIPERANIAGEQMATTSMRFDPRGDYLLVGDAYGRLHVWETKTWRRVTEPVAGHHGEISLITFPRDKAVALTSGRDGELGFWDIASGRMLAAPLRIHAGPVMVLEYDDRTNRLLTAGASDRMMSIRALEPERWIADGCRLFGSDSVSADSLPSDVDVNPCD